MRLHALLFSIPVATMACARPLRTTALSAECFALTWQDTAWADVLPDSIRLETWADSLTVRALRRSAERSSHWRAVGTASWSRPSADSIALLLYGIDSGWWLRFPSLRDSAVGIAHYRESGMERRSHDTSIVVRRLRCPTYTGA